MGYTYRPRQAPRRFFEGAPDIVKAQILDIIGPHANAVCEYDVILRPEPAPRSELQIVGLDFGVYGSRGCHFFLKPHEARGYRDRNRRNRAAWNDLPAATQRAIVAYLKD